MESTATVPTASGSKYLQQLCKHWGHRLPVEFDANRGHVAFPAAALAFAATPEALRLTLTGTDAATLDRMEPVVAAHLQRFAFRETLAVEWART